MYQQIWRLVLVFMLVICAGITLYHVLCRQATAASMFDSMDAHEITATLTRAYELLDTPADMLDVAQLSEVFIDHSDYANELKTDKLTKLKIQIGNVLGLTSVQSFGYLTAMKSKRIHQQQEIKLLKTALEKVKPKGRELTQEEWKDLAKQNGGEYPSLPHYELANNKRHLIYSSIQINGDKARVVYDEGIVDRTAILVWVNGRWFVAGIF
ncbi:MAG: hypothetical protein U0350_21305 [Caldilineaceae bacterium]